MRRPRASDGIIVTTTRNCRIDGKARPGIPVLVWPDGIDATATQWFAYLRNEDHLADTTVHEYANTLRPFLRYCRREERAWETVDDAFLVKWRDRLLEKAITADRVNASIQLIFEFYSWAERRHILNYHVGIYTQEELGPELARMSFPITASLVVSQRRGWKSVAWRSPIKARRGRQTGPRHTPNEEEARELARVVIESSNGVRDLLLFNWAESTGVRRAEVMQLRKSQLPKREKFAQLERSGMAWPIPVVRKGAKIGELRAQPGLIERVYQYIDTERHEIVQRCKRLIVGYAEPDEVFLSSRTGMPLHLDSVTTMARRAFQIADIDNASYHRLRAKFICDTIGVLVDGIFGNRLIGPETNWIETILTKAAEMMGHIGPQSLRPYLTDVLNARIQTSDAFIADRYRQAVKELEQYSLQLRRSVDRYKKMDEDAKSTREGKKAEVARKLRRLASSLEQS